MTERYLKDELPTKPGYYWAKWKIAALGTYAAEELTLGQVWEIVQVNDNNDIADEKLSVAVFGVRETQWPDCFVWGNFIANLGKI